MNRPGLLLTDEPTGNLDEETADAVFSLLRTIQAELGLTVLMATHNLHLASRCDRSVRLHEGRVEAGVPGAGPEGGAWKQGERGDS